jgi:hypothetical protein
VRPLQPEGRPGPGGPDLGVHPGPAEAGHKSLALDTIVRMTATAPARTVNVVVRAKDPLAMRVVWTTVGAKLHLAPPSFTRTFCQREIGADVTEDFHKLGTPICKHCVEQFVGGSRFRRFAALVDAVRAAT